MKKLFSIFTLTLMFLGISTVANAQWRESNIYPGHKAIILNDDREYEKCRDEVYKGDYNYQYGCYEAAITHYDKARSWNNRCRYNHRYISNRELDRKIDDCRHAMHRGERHDYHPRHNGNDSEVGAAIGGGLILTAILGAASSSSKATSAKSSSTSKANSTSNLKLSHFENSNVSYDATCSDLKIKSIERTANATIVNFEFLNVNKSSRIAMDSSIYLKDRTTHHKYFSTAIDGLDYEKYTRVDQGESYEFSVTFPAIAEDCHEVDIVESPTSSWKFYHVNF